MTRDQIVRTAGPLDDATIAAIEAMQTTEPELIEALNWLSNDEGLIWEGHHMPAGRVAELIRILETPEDELSDWEH